MPQPLAPLDLGQLFRDPGMFDSRDAWRDAGFEVFERSDPNKVMVARHAAARGYMFKKYTARKSFPSEDQTENYQRRIEGAQRVRELIADRGLRGVVAPEKWLHELPGSFGSRGHASHVLIVEEVPLMDQDATKRAYGDISKDTLRDLCVVLHAFKGLDSIAKNLPFATDGRIAFIDTEHWDRHWSRKELKLHIGSHLSSKRRKFAEKTFEQLDDAR
jgi:hypothetical protein